MISWYSITALGSFTVMAPAAMIITAWLIMSRAWRLVLWWILFFVGGMILVVASKIVFIGWGIGIRSLDFTGFSGHVMRATSIVPIFMYMLLQKTQPNIRTMGVVLGLLFGVVIAISRLEVHAHSISEVVSGWLLGAVISLGFIRFLSLGNKIEVQPWLILFSLFALMVTPYAEPVPTQRWITYAALQLSGHDRPYIRVTWQLAPVNWHQNIDEIDP